MVKQARGAKSLATREYLSSKPDAGPKEIVESPQGKGVKVTAALVSQVKYGNAKLDGTTKRRGGRKSQQQARKSLGPSGTLLRENASVFSIST